MRLRRPHLYIRRLPHLFAGIALTVSLFTIAAPLMLSRQASAALLQLRSVKLSDGTVNVTDVSYEFGFTTNTSGPIGSISFTVCSNYLYNPTDSCTPPDGFDVSAAALNSSSGITDFSLQPPSNPYTLLITRPVATSVSPQPLTYEFTGITNPSNIGTYYVRIATYASTDGSGLETDYGNVIFPITDSIEIVTEVPPYLLFCTGITIEGYNCGTATGGFISFGELSTTATRAATSQMLASTNAAYGYSVTLAGTTMTAGNNEIPAMLGETSKIGVSQFGLNARSNTAPVVGSEPDGTGLTTPTALYNTPNTFRFQNGDIIVSNANTDDYRKMTISYIVNRSAAQSPGRYVATISYIALANF